MTRQLTIALVIVLATLGPSLSHADGLPVTFVGCPTGQAVRGINFVTRSLVCVPVGGNTAALEARIAALEAALTSAQATIACMHMEGATDLVVEGCNVHVLSGGGATDAAVNGVGNLIIGYNEDFAGFPRIRTGSHNLVVGPFHTYSSFGGLVAGTQNRVTGPHATVSGGHLNGASGRAASVSGGLDNNAGGEGASVSGGFSNTASGPRASVSGGQNRSATGESDWVAGSLFEDF